MARTIALLTALLATVVWPSTGQQRTTDHADVSVAAAQALRKDLPAGRVRLIASPGMERVSERLAHRFGGDVIARPEDALRCPSGPPSCRISGAVGLLRLKEPAITGNQARQTVEVWKRETSARSPVSYRSVVVHLSRAGSGWTVTRIETRTIT